MSFLVKDIIELNLLKGAALAAGFRGAANSMRWVNIMEILDTPGSVQEHELLITTGYQMDDESRHRDLIARLKARGACGIAIQPGYYIPEIPAYILEEADRLDFPVIRLPKELTFSQMMHILLEAVRDREEAPFSPDLNSLAERLDLWEEGEPPEGLGCLIWLIPSPAASPVPEEKFRAAAHRLRQALAKQGRVHMLLKDQGAVLALRGPDSQGMEDLLSETSLLLIELGRKEGTELLAGVSLPAGRLAEGLQDAAKTAEALSRLEARRGLCTQERLGLMEMLSPLRGTGQQPALAQDGPLARLLAQDQQHGTAYAATLRAYLNSGGNLCACAEKLYIHRHTLTNRLDKIEALCGLRLRDSYARLRLSLELVLNDYFAP